MKIERVDYGLTFRQCVELNDANARVFGFSPYAEQRYTKVSRITASVDGQTMFVERVVSDQEWSALDEGYRWRMIQDYLLSPLLAKIRDEAYYGFEEQLKLHGVDTK